MGDHLDVEVAAATGPFTFTATDIYTSATLGSITYPGSMGGIGTATVSVPHSDSVKLTITSGSSGAALIYIISLSPPRDTTIAHNIVTTVCNNDFYRFGYNGQMKDNEIAGLGNHNSALFWEYDTRTGRRSNLDPVPVSSLSSYAVFNNSPVWKNDPAGNSGKAYLTNQVNTATGHPIVKVVSNWHLYGQDATQVRANTVQADNDALYNNNGNYFTTVVNGKTYDVKFEFTTDLVSDANATTGIGKLDAQENYFEVRNDILESRAITGTPSRPGGNTGALKTDDIDNGKKSDAHEANHSFGGENKDYITTRNDVNPDIATPQGMTSVPGKRTVTQANIDAIFKNVTFDQSGQGNVGNSRPFKYDKNSVPYECIEVPH